MVGRIYVGNHYALLHTKYGSCRLQGFREEDFLKLEDLKFLRRSPDLFNNFKIGQGQLQLIIKHILLYHYGSCSNFGQVTLNNLMKTPSNSPLISEKPMFR